ncbi:YidC/Oxa1 family membrane protein insertase [Kitasatospora sp. NBC_01250]|uniref:YidC/Oxa1 family membrane protein insertase n=1 Tax=unclassified Kitasatospora TaxID=2633591 RepID=UPI002E11099F|nr:MULTISPECIES: YidC/Oxa1 family membrane protein insertase [unclassified Kitasatospora]WSJ67420.1 YidC/Oxa1 family membrane protein insertase [Kitasatospora sp. NBC_01302]
MSIFSIFDPAIGLAHTVVGAFAHVVPAAAAIVLFTICVRLALHPLARAAARGEKSRTRLAPRVAELNKKHKGRPEQLQAALAELYREEQASPFAGCLPMLVQIPFFSVMYRLFTLPTVDGVHNDLLGHTLAGVPLGTHLGAAHGVGQYAVFGVLYAALAAVGYVGFRRARAAAQAAPQAPGAAIAPYLAFGTVLFAALVPLAAALYLLTTSAWSAAERALLHRGTGAAGVPAAPVEESAPATAVVRAKGSARTKAAAPVKGSARAKAPALPAPRPAAKTAARPARQRRSQPAR